MQRSPLPTITSHGEPRRSRGRTFVECVLRLSLMLMAFLTAFATDISLAEAKGQPRSPMCGTAAESIAAPPPLVVNQETVAHGCDQEDDFSWIAVPQKEPSRRLGSLIDSSQQFALLPEPLCVPDLIGASSWPLSKSDRMNRREHRWTQLRPPSDSHSVR